MKVFATRGVLCAAAFALIVTVLAVGRASPALAGPPGRELPPPVVRGVVPAAPAPRALARETAPPMPLPREPAWTVTSPVPGAAPLSGVPAGATGPDWVATADPPPPPPPTWDDGARGPVWSATPPPPPATSIASAPGAGTYVPSQVWLGRTIPPPAQRVETLCRLPCEDGISRWHVRAVVGYAFFEGTDPASSCNYYGADIGRTFCGCWGLDAFYRVNSGRFDRLLLERDAAGNLTGRTAVAQDGGWMHHFGVKLTWERSFGQDSRFYYWFGVGPEYFTTTDYVQNDSGFGVFGELGIGYLFNRNIRFRVGVNVHGLDTDVTRFDPANDGQSRWLWIIAPVGEVEIDF